MNKGFRFSIIIKFLKLFIFKGKNFKFNNFYFKKQGFNFFFILFFICQKFFIYLDLKYYKQSKEKILFFMDFKLIVRLSLYFLNLFIK